MILNVRDLNFRYNKFPVIRDVSFDVGEGEIISILGPNGAGKTTLLKCLNRILSPRKGTVLIDGKDSRDMGQARIARKLGWVPQRGESSRMKVYDLILLGRKPYFRWGPGKTDHLQVEEAIRLLGIEALSMCYADEISGGEFQLVQIVRALAQNPRVILFDEPTSSLDISNQHRLMAKIHSLIHAGSRAAVMTMHDINLALRYSDKFILLKDGCIYAAGGRSIITPENIEEVYNMEVKVVEAGGYPIVVPV
ncbi:MAG: ABC transporter ATP-binding protein [Spirochaetales bacterium]|nr:ABC transporter ATP-binding protein [Spirochaetales bacterium]